MRLLTVAIRLLEFDAIDVLEGFVAGNMTRSLGSSLASTSTNSRSRRLKRMLCRSDSDQVHLTLPSPGERMASMAHA